MNKYKKEVIDETELGINPFLTSLVVPVNRVTDKSGDRFKRDGNEWYKGDFEYDSDTYCKIFSDSKRRLRMVGLSPRGKDLLLWLVYEAKKGKDYLWLNKERYMDECKVASVNTYRTALNELIKNGFIIKTVYTDYYWINPQFFFNGSRINAFPDNVKIK